LRDQEEAATGSLLSPPFFCSRFWLSLMPRIPKAKKAIDGVLRSSGPPPGASGTRWVQGALRPWGEEPAVARA
jgi:hypothetical protein